MLIWMYVQLIAYTYVMRLLFNTFKVPSDGSEGDHNLVAFYAIFPILWLLGKPHLVHSDR